VYTVAAEVLAEVRKVKSTQKVSLATPVDQVHVVDTAERLAALEAARQDVCDAGKIAKLEVEAGQPFSVRVDLPEAPA
jgi:valyl-tRNA synthetase